MIHNSITRPDSPASLKNGDNLNIITVARFVKAKDFKDLAARFQSMITRNPDQSIRYIIVGYGPEEPRIRSLISSLGLGKKVDLVINPPNVGDFLKSSDIYLSTSLFEGLSNSLMEAMVEGLPIVATNVGDNRFLVKDGYNGYLLPVKDVEQITLRLETLVKSSELRNTFGMNSLELISESFNEEKLLTGYLQLIGQYTSLLTQKQVTVNEKAHTYPGL